MRLAIWFLAAAAILLGVSPDVKAQSNSYMNLMRSQNQQMMNRARIYSSVRSGARITRYGGSRSRRVAARKHAQVAHGARRHARRQARRNGR